MHVHSALGSGMVLWQKIVRKIIHVDMDAFYASVVHGSVFGFFRNDAMDARDPFAFSSALAPDPTFANFNTTSTGAPIKNSLSRQQYGGSIGFPVQKDRTFLFASFEGLRQNSQNSVPLLTNSSIFAGP